MTLPLLLGAALALILATLPAGSVGRANAMSAPAVLLHDTFDGGVAPWRAPSEVRVRPSTSGDQDAHAMSLVAATGTAVRAKTPISAAGVSVGSPVHAAVSVRVATTGTQVGVSVRESVAGKVVARSTQKATSKAGLWTPISVEHVRTRADSTIDVQVFSYGLSRAQTLLADDVVVRAEVGSEVSPVPPAPDAGGDCVINRRGLPSCGALFGASVGLKGDPSSLEQAPGAQTLGLHRTYYSATQIDRAVATAKRDLEAGRLPWISFKLPHGWDKMAAGAGDAWARSIAQRLAELPGPVWVAFHHEPEKDGPIAQWTALQERLAPIVRQIAPNVAYSVILMGFHQFYGDGQYTLDKIMPNTKIDIVGFDLYNYYGAPNKTRDSNIDMRKEYFDRIAAWTAKHDIAWAIGEIGYTDIGFAADKKWLLKTFRDMVATGGIGMSYFNSAPASATGDWLLDTPGRIAAFTEVQPEGLRLP